MNVDLVLLGLVLIFATLGAFAGAARQVASLLALGAAYFCARPLGTILGPKVAEALSASLVIGVVCASLLVFVGVLLIVRYALTRLLRRALAGRDPEDRTLDRTLGFFLGGLKVALIAYVVLCALTFTEENVTLAGRRLGLSPKDSVSFGLARRYNLFEMTQFKAVNDLAEIARARRDPKSAEKLKADPAFRALSKDPRFLKALEDQAMGRALQTGDLKLLLQSDVVARLIQDPIAAARLEAAADAAGR